MAKKLTPRQKAFLREFLISRNAADAARKAGFSAKAATVQGTRLLQMPHIKAEIHKNEVKLEEKFELTQDRIVAELVAIAFGSMGNLAEWDEESMSLVPKKILTENDQKFVESIKKTVNAYGTGSQRTETVTLSITSMASHKVKALELLGKHQGMWKKGLGAIDKSKALILNYNIGKPPAKKAAG